MRSVDIDDAVGARTVAALTEIFRAPLQPSVLRLVEGADQKSGHVHEEVGRGGSHERRVELGSNFKLIVMSVFAIFVLTLGIEIVMVWLISAPTANQQTIISGMDSVWKGAVGAILGLLGGKVT